MHHLTFTRFCRKIARRIHAGELKPNPASLATPLEPLKAKLAAAAA